MLSIKNLTKKFGDAVAVENLSIDVSPGEIYALIGPNGSGKTTTIKLAAGLYYPTAGDIFIENASITRDPEKAKRAIGYIPDEPFFYDRMTGREFLHLVGVLFGVSEADRNEKIPHLLEIFGLSGIIDGFVENYSRGNKQKVSILAAFLHDPKLLLVDEPIVGLDPESAVRARQLFSDFAKEGGTVFVCTHTLGFVEDIVSRVGMLKTGKLIKEGTIEELRQTAGKPGAGLEELYLHFTK